MLRISIYLNGMTFRDKLVFLLQLPALFLVSRLNGIPLYATRLYFPVSGYNVLLPVLWKDAQDDVPAWFREFDFTSMNKKVFLDIGSNIGFFSAFFRGKKGKKAYLFEINPSINKLLTQSVKSGEKEMIVCGFGLSNEKKEEILYFDSPYSLMGTVHPSRYLDKKNFKERGKVRVYSLDSIAPSLFKKEKIGLIKIDVEGLEEKVLAGARATLKKHLPVVIFEANREGDFEKCEKILAPMGYSFRRLDENNWAAEFQSRK